jgi:hypothetical protein
VHAQAVSLAGQALADIAGLPDAAHARPAPPDDGAWASRAHAEARAALGADYWGRVSLAAARVRPGSPDPVDMLLVM